MKIVNREGSNIIFSVFFSMLIPLLLGFIDDWMPPYSYAYGAAMISTALLGFYVMYRENRDAEI